MCGSAGWASVVRDRGDPRDEMSPPLRSMRDARLQWFGIVVIPATPPQPAKRTDSRALQWFGIVVIPATDHYYGDGARVVLASVVRDRGDPRDVVDPPYRQIVLCASVVRDRGDPRDPTN